jgi:hypothetical protein
MIIAHAYYFTVLVDISNPLAGWIHDGDDQESDMSFSSESAILTARWGNFSDPESGIDHYIVDVFVNDFRVKSFNVGNQKALHDLSMSFSQGDHIHSHITAFNGAGLLASLTSSGFVIDLTPPIVKYIHDTEDGKQFQSNSHTIIYSWNFIDPESGIKEYRLTVYEVEYGMQRKMLPPTEKYVKTVAENITFTGLSLKDGHKYILKVVAINKAGMPALHESEGVTVDISPPAVTKVFLFQNNNN